MCSNRTVSQIIREWHEVEVCSATFSSPSLSLVDRGGDEKRVVEHEEVGGVEQRLEIEELGEAEVGVLLALRSAQEAGPRRLRRLCALRARARPRPRGHNIRRRAPRAPRPRARLHHLH